MNVSMEFTFRLKYTECLAVNCDKPKQHIRTPKADTVLCTCHFNTASGKAPLHGTTANKQNDSVSYQPNKRYTPRATN